MIRFGWFVEEFDTVPESELDLIGQTPFEKWPQQHPLQHVPIRPSMLLAGREVDNLVKLLSGHFQGGRFRDFLYTVVMPGDSIEPHIDHLGPDWRCRVHVPISTNDLSFMTMEGIDYQMKRGSAYKVNPLRTHSVRNDGKTPRLHFMYDVCT